MFKRGLRNRVQSLCALAMPTFALLMAAACVHAESVYKCTDADGGIAFQSQPCAARQRQVTVTLVSAPTYAPSPTYALHAAATGKRRKPRKPRAIPPRASSYACRASDGQVFYRHRGCPHRIASSENAQKFVAVSATKISREQACTQIHRAGAIGRRGHAHDETVSAYDRNLGHDPCD